MTWDMGREKRRRVDEWMVPISFKCEVAMRFVPEDDVSMFIEAIMIPGLNEGITCVCLKHLKVQNEKRTVRQDGKEGA